MAKSVKRNTSKSTGKKTTKTKREISKPRTKTKTVKKNTSKPTGKKTRRTKRDVSKPRTKYVQPSKKKTSSVKRPQPERIKASKKSKDKISKSKAKAKAALHICWMCDEELPQKQLVLQKHYKEHLKEREDNLE